MEDEYNDSNVTNSSTPCEPGPGYSENVIHALIYFRCVLAIISILFISCMLVIMVLFKKYRFFTQRLFLYLAISTLAYQIVSAMDVTSYRAYYDETALQYCKAIGFLTQSLIWWPLIATIVIVFDIFVQVVLEKSTERLEILYLIMIFCVSPFVSVIPLFINSSYGPLQYFCWVATASCERHDIDVAFYVRVALFFIPWYILVLGVVILMIITLVVLRRWRKAYGGKYDPQAAALKKKMEKEIRPILYYPIIFALSSFVSFIITLYGLNSTNEVGYIILSIINSILFRLQGVFLTLLFAFDPETRKKLSVMEIKAAAARFLKEEENDEYPAKYNTRSDSMKTPSDKETEEKIIN